MSEQDKQEQGQPGLISAAFFGSCPQCGAHTLFDGPAKFADRCDNCDLDFGQYNVGDGPAAFLTLVIGALIVALALLVEFSFEPPFWVHVLLWVPITAGMTVFALRWTKGALLITEHRRSAAEGRLSDEPSGSGHMARSDD